MTAIASGAPPSHRARALARRATRRVGERALRGVVPLMVAVWLTGMIDAVTVLGRGGSGSMLRLMHPTCIALGAALGLGLWLSAEALNGFGLALAASARRLGVWAPPSTVWPALAAGLFLTWRLFPMHELFAAHPLGAYITTGYALFPVTGACLLAAWLRAAPAGRARLLAIAAATGVGAGVSHFVNSQYFAGLYPVVHATLTGLTAAWLALGATIIGGHVRARSLGAVGGTLAVTALAAGLTLGDPTAARGAVYFMGTEVAHLLTLVEPLYDRDGDGFAGTLGGGDCDDNNAAVNPLRFERPGNGVDDNCTLGDLPERGRRFSRPGAPPVKALPAWRAAHPNPNVVMIFIDTLRADRVGALGSTLGVTPNIDAFARDAVVFEQARTTAPRTPHAWMSIVRARFTGRTLRCRRSLLPPGRATLPFHMKRRGYHTLAHFVGKSWPRFHLGHGWDELSMTGHANQVTSPRITREAARMIDRAKPPFFLTVHYADPHAPYREHKGFPPRDDSLPAAYAAEVAFTDAEVGRLLRHLEKRGRMKDTVVVIFADHGENLGDHGGNGGHHGVSVFDEVAHVPLIIRGPGLEPRRVADVVSVVDIAPTILALVDGPALPDPDGRSLAGYLLGEPPPPTWAISEFYDFGHRLRAITSGRYKLVKDVRRNVRLLFDVGADPDEQHNLAGAEPERLAALQRTLDTWVEQRVDPAERAPDRCGDLLK